MHRQKWITFIILGLIVGSFWVLIEKKMNLGLDLQGGMHLVLEVDTAKLPENVKLRDAVDRALEIIRNRIDALGVAEPLIHREGEKWIIVQLPGVKETQRAIEIIGKTALLEFKLVDEKGSIDDAIKGKIPENLELLYGKDGTPYLLEKTQLLTGADLVNAQMQIGGQFDNDPYIGFELNPEGAKKFVEVTGKNIGRRLAIILDGKVYSAPNIQSRIAGGKGQITGRFSIEEAKDLATVLRAGALPAPVNIINKSVVGPSLGQDSINKGIMSAIAGILLVIVFMCFYYKFSGFIADLGMIMNLLLLLGAMSLMHATLTLPGIAGIILTMGMSVDSNVLIFERIREEMRAGKTVRAAIDAGYSRALLTVIDSHVTTLITAAVLFQFGSGPVKGFAVSLSVGIIISLYTALVVTRVIFDWRMSKPGVTTLSI
jgi:preprotein translocase subunit SecD